MLPFFEEIRDEVREENPDASIGEVGKILGEEWHKLDDDRKQAYQAQHEKAKKKYQKILARYQKSKNYAAYQEKLAAWKKAKKEAFKAAKSDNKKKVVKRKK